MDRESHDSLIATQLRPLTQLAAQHRAWLDRISSPPKVAEDQTADADQTSIGDDPYYREAWDLPVEAFTAHGVWKEIVGEEYQDARLSLLAVALKQRNRDDGGSDTVPDLVRLLRPKLRQLRHIYKTQFASNWQNGSSGKAIEGDPVVAASAAATAEAGETQPQAETQKDKAETDNMWAREVGMMYFVLEQLNTLVDHISLGKKKAA